MSRQKGRLYEKKVLNMLLALGYELCAHNFTSRYGEVDILVRHPRSDTLVFVEVKARTGGRHYTALEAVNHKKQRRIIATAEYYLLTRGATCKNHRFDVIGIDCATLKIDWIQGAFTA